MNSPSVSGLFALRRLPITSRSFLYTSAIRLEDYKGGPSKRSDPTTKEQDRQRGFRSSGWWIPEHMPEKHPENDPELRRKAAIKYGLLPQDYKPLNEVDRDWGWGNYPDLGQVTYDHKDPYESWTDSEQRRNFGEPVTRDWDLWRPDRAPFTGLDFRYETTWWVPRALFFYGTLAFFIGYLCTKASTTDSPFPMLNQPLMPKQYAWDLKRAWPQEDPRNYPITNYTFEPANAPESHHH